MLVGADASSGVALDLRSKSERMCSARAHPRFSNGAFIGAKNIRQIFEPLKHKHVWTLQPKLCEAELNAAILISS